MGGKSSFTSRERVAMIVVAGVVAIAIAAIALQRRQSTPVVVEKTVVQTAKHTVKDSVDSVAKGKHERAAKAKTHASKRTKAKAKASKPKPTPKPRDYFTAPENE